MGLFDKKYCDICGEKIKLLGNRKLEDGNCCSGCAKKLSPWFSERRHSTVEDIKGQLAYREENKSAVAAFHPTKTYGDDYNKLYIDEAAGRFAVAPEYDLKNGNPDIIDLSAITDVVQETKEHKTEEKRKDKDGKMVSYTPPRYEYSYDFILTLSLDHPYIDSIKIEMNSMSVKVNRQPGAGARNPLHRDYYHYLDMSTDAFYYLKNAKDGKRSASSGSVIELSGKKYMYHYQNPQIGADLDVRLSMVSKLTYEVVDRERFDDLMAKGMLESQLEGKMQMAILSTSSCSPDELSAQSSILENAFMSKQDEIASLYGLKITKTEITKIDIDEKDLENVKKIRMLSEMGGFGQPMQAAVPAEWTCPACGASNTGKFCEYCGTKRP